MKTTVKTEEGRAAVMPVLGLLKPAIFLAVDRGEFGSTAVSLDKNGAYILGNALIHLAQTIEAEEGGYELCNKVSSGVACTFRKGSKCPDCGFEEAAYRAKYEEKALGVRCHGDMCAGGQVACPSPKACGVA